MKKASKVIAYTLILLVVAGGVYALVTFTGGGETDFKTFYVVFNDKIVVSGEVCLISASNMHFETRYLFEDNTEAEHKGYSVKIVPHVSNETKFAFYVDGERHWFVEEKEFTSAFDITLGKTGFDISDNGLSLPALLRKAYKGKTVGLDESILSPGAVYFDLVVSSFDGSQSVTLGLVFKEGLVLNKEVIAF